MAFFLVRVFLPVIHSWLNEMFPKLNLPFLKGYSPNKMNRKMPLVHINVILPSSKSVLITTFKEAAQLNKRETQLLCIPRRLSEGVTNSVFQRSLPLERCEAHFVLQMICPFPLLSDSSTSHRQRDGKRMDIKGGITVPMLFPVRFLTSSLTQDF